MTMPVPAYASASQPRSTGIAGAAPARHVGSLGLASAAAAFVAALAVPLDDPAFVVALMIGLRGGRRPSPCRPIDRRPRR